MGRKVDGDDSTPGQIDPLRHISKAPPPIKPLRGVAVVPPKRIVDFVPPGPRGFATYANAPEILAINAGAWRMPPERLPAKTDMEAHARLIEDGLAAMNERAAGIVEYNGYLVWAPAATWRTSGFLHGRQVGASVLALHGKVVRFPGKYGQFSCYPILACRTLALIFGAKRPPEAPPQDVLEGIQDIEKPARPGRPATKPDDDFEPLAPALEKWFENEWSELPAELQERITRDRRAAMLAHHWDWTTPGWRLSMAQQRDWDDDPANKDERDFWGDVGNRYFELEMIERELKVVPAVGMQAVAARNYEQRLIKAERIALKEDEREVRSAPPTELRATIERVRRRWDERALRSAGLIAAVPENVAEKPRADTEKRNTSKGGAPPRPPPFSYDESDKPLVEEIVAGRKSGRFRSEWQGGRELAHSAKGSEKGDSKAHRLTRKAKKALILEG